MSTTVGVNSENCASAFHIVHIPLMIPLNDRDMCRMKYAFVAGRSAFIPASNRGGRFTDPTFADPLHQVSVARPPRIHAQEYPFDSTPSALALSPDSITGPANALGLGALPVASIALFAITVGFAAQTFINSMLKGDRGLGAFLSDGGGYSRSGFKPRSSKSGPQDSSDAPLGGPDPLPWLKLPQLDFVEVAGQENSSGLDQQEEAAVVARLEELADLMKLEVKAGNTEEANRLRNQLEKLMEEYGFEYEVETGS